MYKCIVSVEYLPGVEHLYRVCVYMSNCKQCCVSQVVTGIHTLSRTR